MQYSILVPSERERDIDINTLKDTFTAKWQKHTWNNLSAILDYNTVITLQ